MDLRFFNALLLPIFFFGYATAEEVDEETARKKILENYDKSVPPTFFEIEYRFTFVGLSVLSLVGLDESKGEFILNAGVFLLWTDRRLDPPHEIIFRFSPSQIWMPHLHILNRVEADEMTREATVSTYMGRVAWAPHFLFRTACVPNLKYYPFDKQICKIIATVENEEGDLFQGNFTVPENYKRFWTTSFFALNNSRWNLISIKSENQPMVVDYDSKTKVGVFTFEIERTMPMIALTVLTPSVISTILLLSTFWMKSGTSVRTGLCATSVVVSAGSLFTLGRILPVTGKNTPIMVEYVSTSLILSALSALYSLLVTILSRLQTQPPVSYSTILEKLPRWTLPLLVLGPPSEDDSTVMDERFLYSELSENDARSHQEPKDFQIANSESMPAKMWDKHIVLLDRLAFYIMGVVILLLVISIILTE